MVLGVHFGFSGAGGVIVLVCLREVGFDLALVVWGWLVCEWVEGGVGVGGASLSGGVLGGFPSEGSRMGFLCLLKGGHGG